jgi:hypothetical protein
LRETDSVIIHPHITPGNLVLYSPPDRDDVQITVTVLCVAHPGDEVVVKYGDGTVQQVDFSRLQPMAPERMAPVVSIRQVASEFAANGGDISGFERWKRKHGV